MTNWSTDGYNFVFTSGSADTTGAANQFGGSLKLWGPNDGSANGLTPNAATVVSFYWAGAQQNGFDGLNTGQFVVSLGSDSQSTAVASNASHGFTRWQKESFTFVPTSSSELLSFLAVGTPNGVPPFSLLDGVSVETTTTLEPSGWGMLLAAFGTVAGVWYSRRKTVPSAINRN